MKPFHHINNCLHKEHEQITFPNPKTIDQCRKNPVTGGAKLWDPNSSKLKKTWINVQGAPFSLKPNRLITLMYHIKNI